MSALSAYLFKGPSFTLENGRQIYMQTLDQCLTHSHALEGIPYGPDVKSIVSGHLGWAQKRYPNLKIVVLEPRLRPLGLPEEDLNKLRAQWERAIQLKEKQASGVPLTADEWHQAERSEPV
jgi:hypothetical protein